MASGRIGGANLLLLVITLGAVLFGVWSFLYNSGAEPAANQGPRLAAFSDPEPDRPAAPAQDRPGTGRPDLVRPDTTTGGSATAPQPTQPGAKVEARLPAGSPSDSGNARMEGKVMGADGKPIAGAAVTAIRSGAKGTPPEYDGRDLEAYRERMAAFLEQSARERRQTTTDSRGHFEFTGLDARLAYDLHASQDGGGSGSADNIAATDSPVIILSADGTLHGKVQTEDGKPVTSFKLRHWRTNRQWEARSQSFSDPEGRFRLNARPGSVQCEVTAPGLTQSGAAEAVIGPEASELIIVLVRAAIVTGTVRDKAGAPLAGATVSLGAGRNEERGGRWGGEWNPSQSVTTDSQGRYIFETLPPKTHAITATFGESASTQNLEAKAGDNTLDFTLDGGARVVLKLTGAGGQPVLADEVWFQGKGGNWPRATRLPAREPGRTEFAGIKPGEYTATITAAGWPALRKPITIKEGENVFDFQFAQGATLAGQVTGAGGAPLSGMSIRLRKDDEDAYGGWGTGRFAQIGADGKFKLGPAEPGQWKLEVYATDGWRLVHSTVVTLAAGENSQNLTVDSAGSVVVTVTDENGASVPWAEVQLRGEQAYNGRTDQNGRAVIAFVQPGTYQVYASSRALSSRTHSLSVRNGENPLTLQLMAANCSRITHVYPDTQAARLGLQVGDLVVEYNGEQVGAWRTLSAAIRKTRAGDDVVMLVERNGQLLTFNLKGGTVGIEGADGVR